MSRARCRVILASLAAAAIGATACAGGPPPAESAAGTLELGPDVPALTANDQRMLDRMTDKNILQHMGTMDSLSAVIAQLGARRASDGAVRRFAGQLVADHLRSLMRGDSVSRLPTLALRQARRDSAGPLVNVTIDLAPGDTAGMAMFRVLDSLRATPAGASFDRAFVASELRMHQHAIAELRDLRTIARLGAVRQHIATELPVLEQHLIAALQLASAPATRP